MGGALSSSVKWEFQRGLVALAGFTAHLSEVRPAAELKPEHQGAVGHCVHIFTLLCVLLHGDGLAQVTFAAALLHGGRAVVVQTLAGRLPGVGEALD